MKKKISIIGVGKLGLCLALNLEKKGFDIIGVDVVDSYINSLVNKTFVSPEPFVNEYLKSSTNVMFTTDLKQSLDSDIIFIVVRTPSTPDWKYDHSQIDSVVNQLISYGVQNTRKDLIINSTTFPGYCDTLQKKLQPYGYEVSYNPEFIAQGSIIQDQVNCDTVLIGESDVFAGDLIEKIYNSLCDSNPIVNRMSRTEAEITKLSVNCFLTTKISYANMIGDIVLEYGGDPKKVLTAVGSDSRIGNKYLNHGFGFGGPCFPRDNRALSKCADEVGLDAIIAKSTDIMNELHLQNQINNFTKNNKDKTIPINLEYVTYKKDSVSIEESQQLKFAIELKKMGYKINVLDNRVEVLEQIKKLL